jgi:DNA-binding NarL/FixJ family response regulator
MIGFWGLAILILAIIILFFTDRNLDVLFREVAHERIRIDFQPVKPIRSQDQRPWREACKAVSTQARLTQREHEVFELLACGRVPENIANHLSLALNTVRSHTRSIYAKLDVHSRSELVALVEKVLAEE